MSALAPLAGTLLALVGSALCQWMAAQTGVAQVNAARLGSPSGVVTAWRLLYLAFVTLMVAFAVLAAILFIPAVVGAARLAWSVF